MARPGTVAIVAAATMLVAAGTGHGPKHHHHHHGVLSSLLSTATAVAPSGGGYTPQSWARALLRAEGIPRTRCNVGAVISWERAEGGHWVNDAQFNPLNTTLPEPGSSPIEGNPYGVQSYSSWTQGFAATLATLNNGRYGGILAALRDGGNAQAVADAEAATPWGTGPFTATCL